MHEILPRRPRLRSAKRIAAATATLVGAALLATTGTAQAAVDEDLPATHGHHDYNGDGHQDLLAVEKPHGVLWLYPGEGDGTFAQRVSPGTGWRGYDIVMAGDLTGDGHPDLLGRDPKNDALYTYPGDGAGDFGTRIRAATGGNAIGSFTSAGDYDTDGNLDLLAVAKSDGKLYFHPGLGDGTFGAGTAIGTGWGGIDTITTPGDVDGDGHYDLFARNSRTGGHYVYFGDGATGLGDRTALPPTIDGEGAELYTQVAAAGDQTGDGTEDLVAIDSRTGGLVLHELGADGTAAVPGRVVDPSWSDMRLPSATVDRTHDYTGDGNTDVIARRASTGTGFLYTGNGTGGFGTTLSWGNGLADMNLLETAGDLDGDTKPDLLARTTGGVLYLYPGDGNGLGTRVAVGTGWNAMSAILGGHDFNSDGRTDIIAREAATGDLFLYPGRGDGTFGPRMQNGRGWNTMTEVTAVGDLDHDGHADVIAVRSSDDCLYFYAGSGFPGGNLFGGVKIGCGWGAMNSLASVGDFNGDGHTDFLARRKTTGELVLYKGDGAGGFPSSAVVGTGWNSMDIIA